MSTDRRALTVFSAISLLFFLGYGSVGLTVGGHGLFQNGIFFHSDVDRVMDDLTNFSYRHYRSNVHPLFVLFFNPIGSVLAQLFHSQIKAAVLLNSISAGLGIGLAGWFFHAAGLSLRRAVLCALILGCSTAHLFFGSMPETYSFSALSIILLFCGMLRRPQSWKFFVPAGLFSFGMLITDLAFAAITFAASHWPGTRLWMIIRRTAIYIAIVLVLGASLTLVQKQIYPRSKMFFVPDNLKEESRFVETPSEKKGIVLRLENFTRYVFGYDWVLPPLDVQPNARHQIKVEFNSSTFWKVHRAGRWTLGLLWAGLALATFGFLRLKLYNQPMPVAIVLCLLFNYTLHSLYGDDFFLYSCNTCFVVLAWLALCTLELPLLKRRPILFDLFLLVLLGCEIANNTRFVTTLVGLRG